MSSIASVCGATPLLLPGPGPRALRRLRVAAQRCTSCSMYFGLRTHEESCASLRCDESRESETGAE